MIKILIISILFLNIIYGQSNSVVDGLSLDWHVVSNYGKILDALDEVEKEKLTEAIPVIEDVIANENPSLQVSMIYTLYSLDAPNLRTTLTDLIARADGFEEIRPWYDPVKAKAEAGVLLFIKYGEQPGLDYAKNYFHNNIWDLKLSYYIDALGKAIDLGYADAKKELLYIIDNDNYYYTRTRALEILNKKCGLEFQDKYIDLFLNDTQIYDEAFSILLGYKNNDIHTLWLQQLGQNTDAPCRHDIAEALLSQYGGPQDLLAVMEQKKNETEDTYISVMGFLIKGFIPPQFNTSVGAPTNARMVGEHIDMLKNYSWFTKGDYDIRFKNIYENEIAYLYESPPNDNEYTAAISDVELFQNDIEQDYDKGYMTVEGYKFLHYELQYLKEQLIAENGE